MIRRVERMAKRPMTTQFVETKPEFTQDGTAYCPLERKRRGPGAILASMVVMLAGAGFLTFSMMSAPAPAIQKQQSATRVVIPVDSASMAQDQAQHDQLVQTTAPQIAAETTSGTIPSEPETAEPAPRIKPITVAQNQLPSPITIK